MLYVALDLLCATEVLSITGQLSAAGAAFFALTLGRPEVEAAFFFFTCTHTDNRTGQRAEQREKE